MMAQMAHTLRIGEVAQLLGVTPKTIRHWEKMGLAHPSDRSPSGYRQYTPADLLRLQRIQRLQVLGLSLHQIRGLPGTREQERPWREVLQALHADVTARIAVLHARQERIAVLLAADSLDAVDRPEDLPPTLQVVGNQFPDHMTRLSPDLLEQDARIFAALDGFHWPEGHSGQISGLLQRLTAQPALYHRLLVLAERLAALAQVAPDDPRVDQLIADGADALDADPAVADLFAQAPLQDATFAAVLQEATLATLSPAQRRVITEMMQRNAHPSGSAARATHREGAPHEG